MPLALDVPEGHVPRSDLEDKIVVSSQSVSLNQLVDNRHVRSTQLFEIKIQRVVDRGAGVLVSSICPVPNIFIASCRNLQDGFAFTPQDVQVRILPQYFLYILAEVVPLFQWALIGHAFFCVGYEPAVKLECLTMHS